MPSSLASIRAVLQTILDDAAAAFWTTSELETHIKDALADLSHHIPLQKKSTLATVASNRDLALTTITPRVSVEAVEYPVGQWPRTFQPFTIWADVLTFTGDTVPNGGNCYVYWTAPHTINGTSTLPEDHEQLLLFGAAARACDQQQADTTDQLTTGGPAAPRDWQSLAAHFHHEYDSRLHPRRGLRTLRTFAPSEPLPTQDSDPGP